jgi:hypothetical protein
VNVGLGGAESDSKATLYVWGALITSYDRKYLKTPNKMACFCFIPYSICNMPYSGFISKLKIGNRDWYGFNNTCVNGDVRFGSAESGTMVDSAAPNLTLRHLSTHTILNHRLKTTFRMHYKSVVEPSIYIEPSRRQIRRCRI